MFWNNSVYKLILLWLLIIAIKLSVQIEHCENPEDFRCSKDLCIKQSYVCNGEKDCPNNWDEENCGKYRLYITYNFNIIPIVCMCKYLYTIKFDLIYIYRF